MTNHEVQLLIRNASNSTKSAHSLKSELNIQASTRTVQRQLKKCSYLKRKMLRKKPPLTAFHKEQRLLFCKSNMQRQWSKVWFTDEKDFV